MGKELHSGESSFNEWGTHSVRYLVGDGGRALDYEAAQPQRRQGGWLFLAE